MVVWSEGNFELRADGTLYSKAELGSVCLTHLSHDQMRSLRDALNLVETYYIATIVHPSEAR